MLDLNVIREQIDGIDKQLVDLFEQRMKLTKEVAEYKIQTGKKVLDTQRERAKIEAVTKLVKNEANVHAIDDLFSQIMANSRKGQYQLLEAMGQTLREPYEAISGFFFCGIMLEPVLKASSNSMNLYSLEFHIHISSENLLKCIIIVESALKNSIT